MKFEMTDKSWTQFRRPLYHLTRLLPGFIRRSLPASVKRQFARQLGPMSFYIDIVSTCNLRCPSCPVGNTGTNEKNNTGRMAIETFKKIIDKIAADFPGSSVGIFNWTEPFLHTDLATFIAYSKRRGLPTSISSNLNITPQMEEVIKAKPDQIIISLSGFTQEVYSRGHVRGNIELVKANMRALSGIINKHGSKTRVEVYFHKYLYNVHEIALMRRYAESLGFLFREVWALYQPLEAIVDYIDGILPEPQKKFIEKNYMLNPKEASEATRPYRKEPCGHWTKIMAINHHGNIQLCCSVFDQDRFDVGPFLGMSRQEIYAKRVAHEYCRTCIKKGLHIYTMFQGHAVEPEFNRISEARLAASEKSEL